MFGLCNCFRFGKTELKKCSKRICFQNFRTYVAFDKEFSTMSALSSFTVSSQTFQFSHPRLIRISSIYKLIPANEVLWVLLEKRHFATRKTFSMPAFLAFWAQNKNTPKTQNTETTTRWQFKGNKKCDWKCKQKVDGGQLTPDLVFSPRGPRRH